MMTEPACRVCGCMQNNACLTPDGPCYWVAPDLCSGCAPKIECLPYGMSPVHQLMVEEMQAQITKALGIPARMFPREQRRDRPGRRPAD